MGKVTHFPTPYPTERGLESTDATGVLTGNTDIPTPEWNPPQGAPERPVLPGCEHQSNLPTLEGIEREIVNKWRRDMRGAAMRAAKQAGLAAVGFLYLLALIAIVALIGDGMGAL
jgi:hypothetical protein